MCTGLLGRHLSLQPTSPTCAGTNYDSCTPNCVCVLHIQELLEVSLSAPGRVTVPRAPPHSLLLYNNQFSPFPAGWGHEVPLVAKFTGERLQLREGGQQMRQEFRERVRNLRTLANPWPVLPACESGCAAGCLAAFAKIMSLAHMGHSTQPQTVCCHQHATACTDRAH